MGGSRVILAQATCQCVQSFTFFLFEAGPVGSMGKVVEERTLKNAKRHCQRKKAKKDSPGKWKLNPRDWLEHDDLCWLEKHLGKSRATVLSLVEKLAHPILAKVQIPGRARGPPTRAMLQKAKRTVIQFYEEQKALGKKSRVYQAFRLASGEKELAFYWDKGIKRVKEAYYDKKYEIDNWDDVYAMTNGDTLADIELVVCGTRPLTLKALTALVCHEGMHCLAQRKRRGQVYLSDDIEHVAMALLGDPQIWVD